MSGELLSTGRGTGRDVWNTTGQDPLDTAHDDGLVWLPTSLGGDADEPASRPPRVWEAEPNLGRLWPMHTRTGAFVLF